MDIEGPGKTRSELSSFCKRAEFEGGNAVEMGEWISLEPSATDGSPRMESSPIR